MMTILDIVGYALILFFFIRVTLPASRIQKDKNLSKEEQKSEIRQLRRQPLNKVLTLVLIFGLIPYFAYRIVDDWNDLKEINERNWSDQRELDEMKQQLDSLNESMALALEELDAATTELAASMEETWQDGDGATKQEIEEGLERLFREDAGFSALMLRGSDDPAFQLVVIRRLEAATRQEFIQAEGEDPTPEEIAQAREWVLEKYAESASERRP